MPPAKTGFLLLVGLQICIIFYLLFLIAGIAIKYRTGKMYVTPMFRDNYTFTVLEGKRTFWEHKGSSIETASAEWLPYIARYTINHDGLNSVHEYTLTKPTGVFRIAVLGDSFTFGAWVNTEDNYPSLLEHMLSRRLLYTTTAQVINLGEIAYDVDFMVRRYWLHGAKYHPDALVMQLCECNITELAGLMDDVVRSQKNKPASASPSTNSLENDMRAIATAHDKLVKMADGQIEAYQLHKLLTFIRQITLPILIITDDMTSARMQGLLQGLTLMYPNVHFAVLPAFDRLPDLHPSVLGHHQIASAVLDSLVTYRMVPIGK